MLLPPRARRGQSPVIGNILMVAIAIILLSVVAVFALGFAEDIDTTAPSASLDTTVGESDVTIRHTSGEILDPTNVEVVVVSPNATVRYPLENLRGDASNDFGAGDTFRLSHGVSTGEVDVRIVHEPSNSLVARSVRTLTDGIISLAAFTDDVEGNDYTGGQNSDASTSTTTVSDGGRTVKLTGSQWKYLAYSYDVTAETIITFEFKSTAEGDIHGIGFEDEEGGGQDRNRILRVYGTQGWGLNVSKNEPYYQQSDEWRRYTVPIGERYGEDERGQAKSLVFVMDCDPTDAVNSGTSDDKCKSQDADGNPTANSYFRNVEVYEADD